MTSRRKRRQQDGFMKKVSSLFNLDTVSKSINAFFLTNRCTSLNAFLPDSVTRITFHGVL
jgi:hypothetical protein